MKRFIYHLTPCLLIIVGIITVSGPAKTSAVSASDWKAGRIIDDSVFTNSTSMTAQEVQNFLNARVPVCDTNGTQLTGRWYAAAGRYYTRAEWGALNGNPAPFTCLKDFWEVPKTDPAPGQPANNYGGAAIPAGAKSAAQIIWDAAQRYQISPKVLLTTIQKESYGPLTSDDWPYRSQYEFPMGAYCPDTAPCDPNYEGFSIQIYESARLFRYYLNNMGQSWWPYKKPNQVNSILYNPNSACGSSNVFIESSATAALYTYTPYQPNAAALANMYGTGDGCSAYGNRNFWRIFSDWFGTTRSPSFSATYVGQSPYQILSRGETKTIYFDFRNTGTAFWKDDLSSFPGYYPVRLAATNPINRWSEFRDSSWINGSRPTGVFSKVFEADGTTPSTDQHTVLQNQIARFELKVRANEWIAGGVYSEYFQPIVEGSSSWDMNAWAHQDIGVHVPVYQANFHSNSPYPTIAQGQSQTVQMSFINGGNEPWYDTSSVPTGKYPVRLASTSPINRFSSFGWLWPSTARPSIEFRRVFESNGTTLSNNQNIVNPGQIAQFEFSLTTPTKQPPGFYQEYFQPILEGAPGWSWNMGAPSWIGVNVPVPVNQAQFVSQSDYPTIKKGDSATAFFRFRNSGNTVWYDELSTPADQQPVRLATSWPINRSSSFGSSWVLPSRPSTHLNAVFEADGITLAPNQQIVLPGQIAKFQFTITVPPGHIAGTYQEYFQPILEGAPGWSWNMGAAVWIQVTVTN